MKKLIATLFTLSLVFIFTKCGGNNPPTPVPTPTPTPNDGYSRGFIKNWTGQGLVKGAPFILSDRQQELPVQFSWAQAGFDIPVRDQESCGSCWAFSTEENFEWAVRIFLGKSMQLAPQAMVGDDYGGCGGGDFDGDHEVKVGLPLEKDCPYEANNRSCDSAPIAVKASDTYNVGDGRNPPTVEQLKLAMMEYGPLSVDVAACFGSVGKNETIDGNCGGIDHMVIIYGWDDVAGVWLMRNSWGKGWGNNGSAPIKYGADSIATDAATVLVLPQSEYKKQHPKP